MHLFSCKALAQAREWFSRARQHNVWPGLQMVHLEIFRSPWPVLQWNKRSAQIASMEVESLLPTCYGDILKCLAGAGPTNIEGLPGCNPMVLISTIRSAKHSRTRNWQGTTNNTKATGRRLDVVLFESRGMGSMGIRGWKIGENECVTKNDRTFWWKINENQVHEGTDKGSHGKSPKREFYEHGTWGRKSLNSLYVKEFDRVLHGACSACRTQGLFYPDDVTLISLGASHRWDPDKGFCFSFGEDGNPWQCHIKFGDMLARLSHNPIKTPISHP